ncbi:hypothetical protein QOT17_012152 [Balamuthia mandrillaris]
MEGYAAFCKLLGVLLGLGMTVQAAMHFFSKSPTTNSILLRWFGLPRLWNASSKDKGGLLPNLLLLASLSMAVSASLYSLGIGIFNNVTYPLLLEPLFLSN